MMPFRTATLRLDVPRHTLAGVTTDPHASLRDRVLKRVLDGPGESDPATRQAAAEGSGVPADLQALVDKIHRHAYRVTDDDIARPQAKYGDDQMFEIVVSAALGASRNRLLAGLEALNEA
jgi:alkylhydroperoxidase family enzyme